jgi:lipopolysaccharide/colanic/teichoic acid biosynthesis glycosyltransferase
VSSDPGYSGVPERQTFLSGAQYHDAETEPRVRCIVHQNVTFIDAGTHRPSAGVSRWSRSGAKLAFDLASVLCTLPLSLPLFLLVGLVVRLTSHGPVLFRQTRMGRNGKAFTIYKFRTMPVHDSSADRPAVTTYGNQEFTSVGPFLRRYKLDELPQLFNVLRGDMSLVGPRPKMPEHQAVRLNCRPGITGRATIIFAQEELALSCVDEQDLDKYYHSVILPLKHDLDSEYMSKATLFSDLRLILGSIMRNWSDHELVALLSASAPHSAWNRPGQGKAEASSAPSVLAAQKMAMTAQRQKD